MKKKRVNKPPFKTITVYMPQFLIDALKEVSEKEGKSKSEILQNLTGLYCQERTDDPEMKEKLQRYKLKHIIDSGEDFKTVKKQLKLALDD